MAPPQYWGLNVRRPACQVNVLLLESHLQLFCLCFVFEKGSLPVSPGHTSNSWSFCLCLPGISGVLRHTGFVFHLTWLFSKVWGLHWGSFFFFAGGSPFVRSRLSAIGVAFESWPKITQWYYIFIFNCSFYIVCGSITVLCICLLILWPCWADSFVEFLETVWDFVSRQLCYLQVDTVLFFLPDIHVIYLFSQYWGSNPGLGRQALYCLNCAPALLLLLCFLR